MGQYYHPISIEKKEYVYAHEYGNGLKLMEHSYVGNNFLGVVEKLISKGGAWYGDKIVWAGDYADPELDENGEVIKEEYEGKMYDVNLYSSASNKINPPDVKSNTPNYLVNLDTKEFVSIKNVPSFDDGWQIHPLPLLTCEGNGRGGGDFHGDDPKGLIGKWARNRVVMETRKPKGFTELIFDLVE